MNKPNPSSVSVDNGEPADSPSYIILAGALGGVLGPLLRVALAFTQQTTQKLDFNFQYGIGSLMLALLGAGVAWGFRETRRAKAIMLGLSLPAFLQVAFTDVQRSNDLGNQRTNHASHSFSFVSSAYAASDGSHSNTSTIDKISSQSMRRTLSAKSLVTEADVAMLFLDPNGKTALTVTLPANENLQIPIPDSAIAIKFGSGDSISKAYPLTNPPNSTTTFQVKANTKVRYNLLSAFGQRPASTVIFDIVQSENAIQPASNSDLRESEGDYTYQGYVGPYGGKFWLHFGPQEQVTGGYSMVVDNGLTLRLEGRSQGGRILLTEYTNDRFTANITLAKRKTAAEVRFEGVMRNTAPDNRVFPVWFSRSLDSH